MIKKIFKPYILLLFLVHFNYMAYTQVQVATPEQFRQFKNTTTCVVNTSKPFSFFNAYLKEAVEADWTITPFKFIDENEFENTLSRTDLSFLLISEAAFTERRQQINLEVLNIVLGQRGSSLDDLPDLGSIPLAYAEDEEEKYLYKIPAFIKLIQYQIKAIENNNINNIQQLMDFHNSFNSEIKLKELWLLEDELSPEINTSEKIRSVYPYSFKIVTKDQIEEAVKNEMDILFLHLVAPWENQDSGRCWKFIISAKDGKVLYLDNQQITGSSDIGLNKNDLENFKR
ncbi:MAG: hypothetical protein PHT69_14910 [Bacteroidales bacterium]|nr:hypothetical protein [Bacteroidales bacterium]